MITRGNIFERYPNDPIGKRPADDFAEALNEITKLREQLSATQAEVEALRLSSDFHDQQANDYAQKVAYWIGKHDAARADVETLRKVMQQAREALGKALKNTAHGQVAWECKEALAAIDAAMQQSSPNQT